jgi:hypothetical protein
MGDPWTIILSKEVAIWHQRLNPADQMAADRIIGLLASRGNQLRMPHSRSLGAGLFELRFYVQRGTVAQRITHTFDIGNRVITLTSFRETRDNERQEIQRARRAKEEL